MNTKVIDYPEVFFDRALRDQEIPLHSITTVLGVRTIRVTNEIFLTKLRDKLVERDLCGAGAYPQVEFAYVNHDSNIYGLRDQVSIVGKGGFTVTIYCDGRIAMMTFDAVGTSKEFYVNDLYNGLKREVTSPILAYSLRDIVSDPVEVLQDTLIDHIVRKFLILKGV